MSWRSHWLISLLVSALGWGCSAGGSRAAPATEAGVIVTIGGDCSFAREIATRRADQVGWGALIGSASQRLAAADLAIVNLESPLGTCLDGGTPARPRLCGDARAIESLRRAGIDAVTVANNHALDSGEDGLATTVELLAESAITTLGADAVATGQPTVEPLGEIAVVAVNLTPPAHQPGAAVPIPPPEAVAAAVTRATADQRQVLVILHLGRELDRETGEREARYGRAAVAAGAAAVVMHGAHVIRALIEDAGVPVHLGLGNLLFDQRDSRARLGGLLTLRLVPGRPAEVAGFDCVDSHTGDLTDCPPGWRGAGQALGWR